MTEIKKYLKYAKDLEVKPPSEDIVEKIIYKVSHLKDEDKVLDENFLAFLKNSNSRYYLIKERIRTNPGKSLLLLSIFLIAAAFIAAVAKNILRYEVGSSRSSSPEDKP